MESYIEAAKYAWKATNTLADVYEFYSNYLKPWSTPALNIYDEWKRKSDWEYKREKELKTMRKLRDHDYKLMRKEDDYQRNKFAENERRKLEAEIDKIELQKMKELPLFSWNKREKALSLGNAEIEAAKEAHRTAIEAEEKRLLDKSHQWYTEEEKKEEPVKARKYKGKSLANDYKDLALGVSEVALNKFIGPQLAQRLKRKRPKYVIPFVIEGEAEPISDSEEDKDSEPPSSSTKGKEQTVVIRIEQPS